MVGLDWSIGSVSASLDVLVVLAGSPSRSSSPSLHDQPTAGHQLTPTETLLQKNIRFYQNRMHRREVSFNRSID